MWKLSSTTQEETFGTLYKKNVAGFSKRNSTCPDEEWRKMILLIFFIIVGFWALNFCHSNEKTLAGLSKLQDTFPDECFEEKITFGKHKSFYSFSVLARSCWNLAEKSSEGMSKLHCSCSDEFLKTRQLKFPKIYSFFHFRNLSK